jgi:protease-4
MMGRGRIAIIPIRGSITSEELPPFSIPRVTSTGEVIGYLEEVKKNRKTKSIVLEINSPGGTPYPCKEIAQAVKSVKKPTVAWIKESATSGAYWIASSCDKIVADRLSTLGSIGVASIRPDFSELLKKFGIDVKTMATGIYKTLGLPFKKSTPKEKEVLEKEIRIIHKNFMEEVTRNRGLKKKVAKEVAKGRVYLGEEAKTLGLVDYLGGRAKALEIAKEAADITTYRIVDYNKRRKKPKSILRRLIGEL